MSGREDRERREDLGLSAIPESRPQLSAQPADVGHECRDGWAGTPDRPRPCPICKPHLIRRGAGWRNTTRNRRTPR